MSLLYSVPSLVGFWVWIWWQVKVGRPYWKKAWARAMLREGPAEEEKSRHERLRFYTFLASMLLHAATVKLTGLVPHSLGAEPAMSQILFSLVVGGLSSAFSHYLALKLWPSFG